MALPRYKIKINEDDTTGVEKISLVDSPAIQVNWKAFNNQKPIKLEAVDNVQQKLAGPFLIPDLPIYRRDEEQGEYEVVFEKETIEQIARKFNRQAKANAINVNHTTDVKNIYVLENWIVEDDKLDKSRLYGFNNETAPVGTWFGIVHVIAREFWDEFIATGELKGFSIEGLLGMSLRQIIEPTHQCLHNEDTLKETLIRKQILEDTFDPKAYRFRKIKFERWVAKGDDRTCPICVDLHNMGWVLQNTLPRYRKAHSEVGLGKWRSDDSSCRCQKESRAVDSKKPIEGQLPPTEKIIITKK